MNTKKRNPWITVGVILTLAAVITVFSLNGQIPLRIRVWQHERAAAREAKEAEAFALQWKAYHLALSDLQKEREKRIESDTAHNTFKGSAAAVGSVLEFGTYEQDGDPDTDAEPIRWQVLEIRDGNALLISEQVLTYRKYYPHFSDRQWAGCGLRKWLNGEFIETAFSKEEQEQIAVTTVSEAQSLKAEYLPDETDWVMDTEDKVFLLNEEEAELYFATPALRGCSATTQAVPEYNRANAASEDTIRHAKWYTRTHAKVTQTEFGPEPGMVAVTDFFTGKKVEALVSLREPPLELAVWCINERGVAELIKDTAADVGVRPALWVKMDP